jgi:A/G-specific adenine glycosylase
MERLTRAEAAAFRKKVYAYYRLHARHFPWRDTTDPYRILVSEVMLQQTQTHRVIPKYRAFLRSFPTVRSLARAPRSAVLSAWQGLGYNRRALLLQKAAQQIVTRHKGKVPSTLTALNALPGIGAYTAAAVQAFAFNEPGIMLETNIRSALIHEFFPRKKRVADTDLIPLLEATLDARDPRRWYSALMDYGAMIKLVHGNATRRSTTYARQSPFAGSDRALRGKLLRLLLEKPRAVRSLPTLLQEDRERLDRIVKQLITEGFAAQRGARLFIGEH